MGIAVLLELLFKKKVQGSFEAIAVNMSTWVGWTIVLSTKDGAGKVWEPR